MRVLDDFLKKNVLSSDDVQSLKQMAKDTFTREFGNNPYMIRIFDTMEQAVIELLEDAIEQQVFQELIPTFVEQLSTRIAPLCFEGALAPTMR